MTLLTASRRRASRLRSGQVALAVVLLAGLSVAPARPDPIGVVGSSAVDLPARLTDREFWQLVEDLSEPNGFFRSDNLVSNEDTFQYVIPRLTEIVKPGGVYLGVGPDQNFTYIAALRPRMAFITDIRRGNLHAHLMYKALFELSADRAEFLSRLFSRPRPAGVGATSTVEQLFDAYAMVNSSEKLATQNLRAIVDHLRQKHGFPIDRADESGIAYVYSAFYQLGPFLSYSSAGMVSRGTRYPTYQDLQLADDDRGVQRGYLASEANFKWLKTLQQNNLVVPVVGDFAGPKALRAVGAWVRARGGTVTTFYTSNVEQYLFQSHVWDAFARNVASLPLDASSTLLRSCFNQCRMPVGARSVTLLDSLQALVRDHQAGRIAFYVDVLSRTR
jgi:hypothetical protein